MVEEGNCEKEDMYGSLGFLHRGNAGRADKRGFMGKKSVVSCGRLVADVVFRMNLAWKTMRTSIKCETQVGEGGL